jgi:hypothetical protein
MVRNVAARRNQDIGVQPDVLRDGDHTIGTDPSTGTNNEAGPGPCRELATAMHNDARTESDVRHTFDGKTAIHVRSVKSTSDSEKEAAQPATHE